MGTFMGFSVYRSVAFVLFTAAYEEKLQLELYNSHTSKWIAMTETEMTPTTLVIRDFEDFDAIFSQCPI